MRLNALQTMETLPSAVSDGWLEGVAGYSRGVTDVRLVLLGAILGALGCGEAPPEAICDGSDRVRLAAYTAGGGPPSSPLESEVGYEFLYVNGRCEYAVNLGDWLGPTRRGVLDPARASVLSSRLDFRHWPSLAGAYGQPAFDAGALVFDSGRLDRPEISCSLCEDLPESVDRIVTGYHEQAVALHAEGTELTGPVRFIVWTGRGGPFPPVDASGSPLDFAALAEVSGTTTPTAHVTETDAQAASLRALRTATLAEPVARNAHTPYVTVRDAEGRVFWIEMRDVLPMEGSDHAVHLRSPAQCVHCRPGQPDRDDGIAN